MVEAASPGFGRLFRVIPSGQAEQLVLERRAEEHGFGFRPGLADEPVLGDRAHPEPVVGARDEVGEDAVRLPDDAASEPVSVKI